MSARLHVSHGSNVTRVVAVRGFSSSQWRRLVAKSVESTADSTQKATKVAKKKTTTTAAGAVKKTTIEKKVIATKKAVKPKPKPKPKKVKAVLTPEQKKEREDKLKLKELKQLSLMSQQPTLKPNRSWSVFVAENHGRIEGELTFLDKVQELKGEWQAMPESEKQVCKLNHSSPCWPSRTDECIECFRIGTHIFYL